MGNASAKEVGNGDKTAEDGDGAGEVSGDDRSSEDTMRSSQPPPLVAPQIPTDPLQRPTEMATVSGNTLMNNSHKAFDLTNEKGIPTLITWSYGGKEVFVEGSWDNWTSRKPLQRSGKDHVILLVLPVGVYHFKFIVDGEWKHIPDLPFMTDEMGRAFNVIDVNGYVPEIVDGVSEFEGPPSPQSSYSQSFSADEDYAKEPLALPSQLNSTVLGSQASEECCVKPEHVVLNHLYIEKGWAAQSVVALGLTHRFQTKYVTVVLYKPLRRH